MIRIILMILILMSSLVTVVKGQVVNVDLLNDISCELFGNDYLYESYTTFFNRSENQQLSYERYKKDRFILNDSLRIIFINEALEFPKGTRKEDFYTIKRDTFFVENPCYFNLFMSFLENYKIKSVLNINMLENDCQYQFASLLDKRIKYFRPSERVIFSFSNITYSNDNQRACFYMAGGRGGYVDFLVFVKKDGRKWTIVDKINVTII